MKPVRRGAVIVILLTLVLVAGAALAKKPVFPTCDNTKLFDPRIPLGVSGGNLYDVSTQFCCSGTLGCLVQKGGKQFILSNNHVLAITNNGTEGEPVIQPGLVDTNCGHTDFNVVGTLSDFVPINFSGGNNTVDAAIAQVEPGAVQTNGAINCVGSISSTPAAASIGLKVQKSGRTSGLTTGTVGAVEVTVSVAYDTSCGLGPRQIATFVNQVMIKGGNFSRGGDSGSLVLTKPDSGCPRPVGLLFAGGANQTFANRIDLVLDAFGVAMVGDCGTAAATGAMPGNAGLNRAKAVKERHEEVLLKIEGVVGMGIGLSEDGTTHVIEVYVKKHTPEMERQLPKRLDGVKVRIVETGEVRAL